MGYRYAQGDIVWLNFSPSFGKEMKGKHPALIVSSNAYNKKTNYVMVCPITTGGNKFAGYIPLEGYQIVGRVNATQLHSFDIKRIMSTEFVDRLREEDFLVVKQVLDYALNVDL